MLYRHKSDLGIIMGEPLSTVLAGLIKMPMLLRSMCKTSAHMGNSPLGLGQLLACVTATAHQALHTQRRLDT